ncbi:phosphatase PAP2 family protein [Bacillus sp. FSL L8-0199]|uniref:Phosphatase PAP2 family protein n=1 Tax=Bacillus thuringiensis TaxID=1428 RepID=A0AAW4HNI6_BACTU|nr:MULTISPECIES: phosphatase PAP2 family protein [Bacillus cereus group]QQP80836.1 phosphatase PAP2 family protein [Bacillus sp. TK-2]MBN9897007.1 phosphatase PAP2 family protein [Bacillus thuringiensis]MCC2383782.1 phosphatase PAP2 family protein [Bacillus cereus]MCU5273896.1 phosphatase PAP2 family protein [Bacillus cereus]MDY7519945.1 phosphatase PAP2 family protein [Bacillus thuringiensis]
MNKKLHQYEVMCIGLLFAVFGIVAWRVHAGGVTVMDTYVRGLVRGLQTESSLIFFSYFTKLGSAIGIVATLVISLLVFWKKRYYAVMIVYPMGILITHLVNKGIKEIVKRERPSLNEALDALGYSFPSGHAMLSIMTFGFLTYIIAANLKSVAGKCVTTILMGIVILSIGLSRVILNVHYPTDILAGYCVGGILLIIAIYYHRLLTERLGLNKER